MDVNNLLGNINKPIININGKGTLIYISNTVPTHSIEFSFTSSMFYPFSLNIPRTSIISTYTDDDKFMLTFRLSISYDNKLSMHMPYMTRLDSTDSTEYSVGYINISELEIHI